jgi:hypothetical protein
METRAGNKSWKQELETRAGNKSWKQGECEGGCDIPATTSPLVLSNATDAALLRERR